MPSELPTLDELRREIDRIDEAMHDLLIDRTDVVEDVGRAKALLGEQVSDRPQFFRPGREALILRRLLARHRGPFPARSLVRIWREIITGQLRVQTEVAVAVYSVEGRRMYWDMARDQYGAGATYQPYQRTHQVVSAVRNGSAAIGVLPMPQDDDGDPWWPLLASDGRNAPRIVSRLPFAPQATSDSGLAIACVDPEATGDDHSYLLVETDGDASNYATTADLASAGFKEPRQVVATGERRPGEHRLLLYETDEMVLADDPRLDRVVARTRQPITRVVAAGGYAVPLSPAQLDHAERESR